MWATFGYDWTEEVPAFAPTQRFTAERAAKHTEHSIGAAKRHITARYSVTQQLRSILLRGMEGSVAFGDEEVGGGWEPDLVLDDRTGWHASCPHLVWNILSCVELFPKSPLAFSTTVRLARLSQI